MCLSSRDVGVEYVKYTEGHNRMDTVPLKDLLYFFFNCHGIPPSPPGQNAWKVYRYTAR